MNISLPYRWKPRAYQESTFDFFFPDSRNKRAVVIAHRRWGKDHLAINLCACKAHERIGTFWHLLPSYKQGRAIIWNGADFDGRRFLDYFPPQLVKNIHVNDMRVEFKNGSIYQVVGSDEVDRLVGTNPIGVVLSEYALQDPRAWDYISPILRENKGFALFITTLRGKNHAYRLSKIAERHVREGDPEWFLINQTVDDTLRDDGTPVVSKEDIEKERKAGRPEALILQEFYNNPEAPLQGAYFATEMSKVAGDGRIKNVGYDPKLFVDTAWDLGFDDSTTIIFFQQYGREIRIIDTYESSGEALRHYVRILKERNYPYGKHYLPHDVMVHSLNDGKTRFETLRTLGLKPTVTFKHGLEDGIEQVRNVLPLCWFDERKCERLIEALRSYRKEEAPAKLAYTGEDNLMPMFKDNPLHDWSSHWADSFRILAWNIRAKSEDPNHDQWKGLPTSMTDDNYQWC